MTYVPRAVASTIRRAMRTFPTRLARDVGASAPTARRWLNVLVTSRLVHLLLIRRWWDG